MRDGSRGFVEESCCASAARSNVPSDTPSVRRPAERRSITAACLATSTSLRFGSGSVVVARPIRGHRGGRGERGERIPHAAVADRDRQPGPAQVGGCSERTTQTP